MCKLAHKKNFVFSLKRKLPFLTHVKVHISLHSQIDASQGQTAYN